MNFLPTPEARTFQSEARAYLQEVTDGWDIPLDDEEYQARARIVREGLGERGWLTLNWGPPFGEPSPVKAAILQEELAYHLVPRANDHGTDLTGPLLLRHGTPGQRERHLGPLAEGREWWCVGFTEPLAGSDLANIKTRAVGARRQLRPDRPEGLRRMGPTLGVVPPARPDRERVDGARRADLVPAGHVDPRPLPQPRRVHHGPSLRRDISRRCVVPEVRNPRGAGAGMGHRRRVPDRRPAPASNTSAGPEGCLIWPSNRGVVGRGSGLGWPRLLWTSKLPVCYPIAAFGLGARVPRIGVRHPSPNFSVQRFFRESRRLR